MILAFLGLGNLFNPASWVGDFFTAIQKAVASVVNAIAGFVVNLVQTTTTPSSASFESIFTGSKGHPGLVPAMMLPAAALGAIVLLAGVIDAVIKGDTAGLARRALLGPIAAAAAIGLFVPLLTEALALVDWMCATFAASAGGLGAGLGHLATDTLVAVNQVPALAVVIGVIEILALMAIWVELAIRSVLVVLMGALFPLVVAGIFFPQTAKWVRRFVELLLAVVMSQLIITVVEVSGTTVLGQGGKYLPSAAAIPVGLATLLIGAFALPMAMRLAPHTIEAAGHFGRGGGHAASFGRGAVSEMRPDPLQRMSSGPSPADALPGGATPGSGAASGASSGAASGPALGLAVAKAAGASGAAAATAATSEGGGSGPGPGAPGPGGAARSGGGGGGSGGRNATARAAHQGFMAGGVAGAAGALAVAAFRNRSVGVQPQGRGGAQGDPGGSEGEATGPQPESAKGAPGGSEGSGSGAVSEVFAAWVAGVAGVDALPDAGSGFLAGDTPAAEGGAPAAPGAEGAAPPPGTPPGAGGSGTSPAEPPPGEPPAASLAGEDSLITGAPGANGAGLGAPGAQAPGLSPTSESEGLLPPVEAASSTAGAPEVRPPPGTPPGAPAPPPAAPAESAESADGPGEITEGRPRWVAPPPEPPAPESRGAAGEGLAGGGIEEEE